MVLGISGPMVSLAIFLAMATIGSIRLAQKARAQISTMFDQDNRSALTVTTSIIQKTSEEIDRELGEDALELRGALRPLAIDAEGQLSWKGRPLDPADAPALLNDTLRLPMALREERASIFYEVGAGQWRRLTGITSRGKALQPGWQAPAATVKEFHTLFGKDWDPDRPHKALIHRDGEWLMAYLVRLPTPQPAGRRMVLVLAVGTDAATKLLAAGTSLFPYRTHQTAFFGLTPTGSLYCDYESPGTRACHDLAQALRASGGIPDPRRLQVAKIFERQTTLIPLGGTKPRLQHLYIATFPNWNFLAVIAVQGNALEAALTPMQNAVALMVQRLVLLTLMLIIASGIAAWFIARGIRRELSQLAQAADAIADGQQHETLAYPADDAIGQLVKAFNRMSGAVADREESLRERIRDMEININTNELQGQVCSILNDPSFAQLSERAKAMRARRQQQFIASGRTEPEAAGSPADLQPPGSSRDPADTAAHWSD
jgi:HAMP domain-containing protein